MPVNAQIRTIDGDGLTERNSPRHQVILDAELRSPSGDKHNVIVHNISETGILLQTAFPLAKNEILELVLPEAGRPEARVVWADGQFYGCEFIEPIPPAALSAAQLKSAVEDPSSVERRANGGSCSFGGWLKTLREQKGLASKELAELAGVSKVTLWNWETDQAKPQPRNVSKLARALEISESYLLNGWEGEGEHRGPRFADVNYRQARPSLPTGEFLPTAADERLAEMVFASKSQIAELAGTTNDKVRIIIEY